jgi:glycosyltransferase involved in cell wall biosynthesis
MPTLTFAFCTYKRADRLDKLVAKLREQSCPVPFEILAVNNNSPDDTLDVLARLQNQPGAPLRIVTEATPGIVPARNRALAEALDRDILVFIDDDELPQSGLLEAAYDAIVNEGAQCAGGCVEMDFSAIKRPDWLEDNLLGFLAAVDHGPECFWITSPDTPIWTANIAYDMRLFREDSAPRFDLRYNRKGTDIGGGEDAMMLRALKRSYFLKLHFRAGIRFGMHQLPNYPKTVLGLPPFLIGQFFQQSFKTLVMQLLGRPGALRQGMNAAHALGTLIGFHARSQGRP